MRMKRFLIGVAALVAMGGCAFLGRQLFKQPVVTLQDVRLVGLGVFGGNLDVVVSVYNPNDYQLDATQLRYQLLVDTVAVADGTLTDRQAFRSGDSTIVHIPVQFSYNGVNAAGRELMQTGAVDYQIVGDVTVGSPIGTRTFPFTSRGRFSTLNSKLR
ncbi:MAG: hypothetical protein B7Z72_05830 [Gemmatimonadetes bacterium 21-71-4]|nr:MAG: hypothetical protein B7Z72_05830 [Gemmatimonadetes bacterium 21-71-4]